MKFAVVGKKSFKLFLALLVLFPQMGQTSQANDAKPVEKIHALSKKSVKGYLFELSFNEAGNIEVIYYISLGKKQFGLEIYEFDKSLNFLGVKEVPERKTRYKEKPTKTKKVVDVSVGGGSSFNILSTKLNLHTATKTYTWDVERQKYRVKRSDVKDVKARNVEDNKYNGVAANQTSDGLPLVLATSVKNKEGVGKIREFSLLKIGENLDIEDIPIEFAVEHTLVYTFELEADIAVDEDNSEEDIANDIVYIFAPNKGNMTEYTWLQIDGKGKIKHRFIINAPGPVMAITAHNISKDGQIYLCALTSSINKSFDGVIGEYTPIENNHYLKYGTPNYRMETYERKMEKFKFESFTTLKIQNGKLIWMNSTPIKDFKSKLVTPPNQKKGYSYEGRRFVVNNFILLPDESFLISGQIKVAKFKQEPKNYEYTHLICLRIDKSGQLMAQFSYKPGSESDKNAVYFQIPQQFIVGKDKNNLYWVNYEIKTTSKTYSSFAAYSSNQTTVIMANYYPSIGKIDLATNKISNFEIAGKGSFYVNRPYFYIRMQDGISRVFLGQDKKGKIMLLKYDFN